MILFVLQDPSFHVSIAWAAGDVSAKLNAHLMEQMNSLLDDTRELHDGSAIRVSEINLKTGNKDFVIPLAGGVR